MSATVYTQSGCLICLRILAYLRHIYGDDITIQDAAYIETIRDAELFSVVRRDLAWQDDAFPLVYINGVYQEFGDLKKRVLSWEIAQREAECCEADLLF